METIANVGLLCFVEVEFGASMVGKTHSWCAKDRACVMHMRFEMSTTCDTYLRL